MIIAPRFRRERQHLGFVFRSGMHGEASTVRSGSPAVVLVAPLAATGSLQYGIATVGRRQLCRNRLCFRACVINTVTRRCNFILHHLSKFWVYAYAPAKCTRPRLTDMRRLEI